MVAKPHAVVVFAKTPKGLVPTVKDHTKPAPIYRKLPGGKGEPGESPLETALREFKEETGVKAKPKDLLELKKEDRKSHDFYFFSLNIPSLDGMRPRGDEGEEVEAPFVESLKGCDDLFPPHRRLMEEFGLFG